MTGAEIVLFRSTNRWRTLLDTMRKEKSESKFGRTNDTKVVEHLVEQGHFACFEGVARETKERG